jgi:hypothetical protein
MGRPENPITWDGPAAGPAARLRELRDQAGRPPYQALARAGHYSPAALADAAAGRNCPTWEVTRAYAEACGAPAADVAALHPLWARADAAARRSRGPAPRRRARPARQLRALRAWAGDPGHKEISRRAGRRLPSSTLYDALRPGRASLPPLAVVQAIAAACASPAAAPAWTSAWRAIRLAELDRDDPREEPAAAARPPGTGPRADLRIVRG